MSSLIKIGGVPEHFNLPWQLALENGLFESANIDVQWSFYAGGTGAMTAALSRGELDMAILLTEGYTSAVSQGLKATIVKTYIESPLVWGIYTGFDNPLNELDQQQSLRYAVSRFGSGSHLMAMVHARKRGIRIDENQFQVIQSLHGGIDALISKKSDVFYWEKFMTRPFVKDRSVRLIGEFQAPWSGFLIVAENYSLLHKEKEIKAVLDLMIPSCIQFKESKLTPQQLMRRFEMTETESRSWLHATEWNNNYNFNLRSLENAKTALGSIGYPTEKIDTLACLAPWLKPITLENK